MEKCANWLLALVAKQPGELVKHTLLSDPASASPREQRPLSRTMLVAGGSLIDKHQPSGAVTSGLAIYDTMQFIRPPVSTLCVGQAGSMSSLLL